MVDNSEAGYKVGQGLRSTVGSWYDKVAGLAKGLATKPQVAAEVPAAAPAAPLAAQTPAPAPVQVGPKTIGDTVAQVAHESNVGQGEALHPEARKALPGINDTIKAAQAEAAAGGGAGGAVPPGATPGAAPGAEPPKGPWERAKAAMGAQAGVRMDSATGTAANIGKKVMEAGATGMRGLGWAAKKLPFVQNTYSIADAGSRATSEGLTRGERFKEAVLRPGMRMAGTGIGGAIGGVVGTGVGAATGLGIGAVPGMGTGAFLGAGAGYQAADKIAEWTLGKEKGVGIIDNVLGPEQTPEQAAAAKAKAAGPDLGTWKDGKKVSGGAPEPTGEMSGSIPSSFRAQDPQPAGAMTHYAPQTQEEIQAGLTPRALPGPAAAQAGQTPAAFDPNKPIGPQVMQQRTYTGAPMATGTPAANGGVFSNEPDARQGSSRPFDGLRGMNPNATPQQAADWLRATNAVNQQRGGYDASGGGYQSGMRSGSPMFSRLNGLDRGARPGHSGVGGMAALSAYGALSRMKQHGGELGLRRAQIQATHDLARAHMAQAQSNADREFNRQTEHDKRALANDSYNHQRQAVLDAAAAARDQRDYGNKTGEQNQATLAKEHEQNARDSIDPKQFSKTLGGTDNEGYEAAVKAKTAQIANIFNFSTADSKKDPSKMGGAEKQQLYQAIRSKQRIEESRSDLMQKAADYFGTGTRVDSRNAYSYMPDHTVPATRNGETWVVKMKNGNNIGLKELNGGKFQLMGPNTPVDADMWQQIEPLIKAAKAKEGKK